MNGCANEWMLPTIWFWYPFICKQQLCWRKWPLLKGEIVVLDVIGLLRVGVLLGILSGNNSSWRIYTQSQTKEKSRIFFPFFFWQVRFNCFSSNYLKQSSVKVLNNPLLQAPWQKHVTWPELWPLEAKMKSRESCVLKEEAVKMGANGCCCSVIWERTCFHVAAWRPAPLVKSYCSSFIPSWLSWSLSAFGEAPRPPSPGPLPALPPNRHKALWSIMFYLSVFLSVSLLLSLCNRFECGRVRREVHIRKFSQMLSNRDVSDGEALRTPSFSSSLSFSPSAS